jgi:hypothetical protein
MKLCNNVEKSFGLDQSKMVCQLLDQNLWSCCLLRGFDLNQNLWTREAEQNKWSCWIKLIFENVWICQKKFNPEVVEIWEGSFLVWLTRAVVNCWESFGFGQKWLTRAVVDCWESFWIWEGSLDWNRRDWLINEAVAFWESFGLSQK